MMRPSERPAGAGAGRGAAGAGAAGAGRRRGGGAAAAGAGSAAVQARARRHRRRRQPWQPRSQPRSRRRRRWGADGGHLTVFDGDVGEVAVEEGLDVHVSLVGLDDDDGVALADLLALALEPGDDLALGQVAESAGMWISLTSALAARSARRRERRERGRGLAGAANAERWLVSAACAD